MFELQSCPHQRMSDVCSPENSLFSPCRARDEVPAGQSTTLTDRAGRRIAAFGDRIDGFGTASGAVCGHAAERSLPAASAWVSCRLRKKAPIRQRLVGAPVSAPGTVSHLTAGSRPSSSGRPSRSGMSHTDARGHPRSIAVSAPSERVQSPLQPVVHLQRVICCLAGNTEQHDRMRLSQSIPRIDEVPRGPIVLRLIKSGAAIVRQNGRA